MNIEYKGYLIEVCKTPNGEYDWWIWKDSNNEDDYPMDDGTCETQEKAFGAAKRNIDCKMPPPLSSIDWDIIKD